MPHYIGDAERVAIRRQAVGLAVAWANAPGTRVSLFELATEIERYIVSGNPEPPETTVAPEPERVPKPFDGTWRQRLRIVKAARDWYDAIPVNGGNLGAWVSDKDQELINAVRALRGEPEFDWNGSGPWMK